MTSKRIYRLVVTTRFGGSRQVYCTPSGYSYRRGKGKAAKMTPAQITGGKQWAKRRLATSTRVVGPNQWPFLQLASGAHWPTNQALLRALNATGQGRRRQIRIISGMRTPRQAWELRMAYLNGTGNTAARCCSKYSGTHSWDACGKDPWSNHADGNAADCGTLTSTGRYTSLANDTKARRIFEHHGGCFPVTSPFEPWHAELR